MRRVRVVVDKELEGVSEEAGCDRPTVFTHIRAEQSAVCLQSPLNDEKLNTVFLY